MNARTPWLRRNAVWLAVLPFVLALTLLAASQRLTGVYLPWQPSSAQRPEGGIVELDQTYSILGDVDFDFHTRLELGEVTRVDAVGDVRPAIGAQLWQVEVYVQAPPEQVMFGCTAELVADGVRYGYGGGKVVDAEFAFMPPSAPCTPERNPGPMHTYDFTDIQPVDVPRPERYLIRLVFSLPEGVTLEELRLWWHTPEYASFPLPPA